MRALLAAARFIVQRSAGLWARRRYDQTGDSMPLYQLIVLAIVQGITEFLPISSTAHLRLMNRLMLQEGQSFKDFAGFESIEVALHVGSLMAVLVFFRRETWAAISGPFTLIGDMRAKRALRPQSKLAVLLVIATIPAILLGLAFAIYDVRDMLSADPRLELQVIGWTTVVFGALLYIADRFFKSTRTLEGWTYGSAVWMGLGQALALIPGVSRSGVCITMARFLGYGRYEAARIAMLMAIPTILAAGGFDALKLMIDGSLELGQDAAIAAGLSFIAAFVALALMMQLLSRVSFTPYVIYRFLLGGVLLWTAYANV